VDIENEMEWVNGSIRLHWTALSSQPGRKKAGHAHHPPTQQHVLVIGAGDGVARFVGLQRDARPPLRLHVEQDAI
jgi:hypothetical protein